MSIHQTKLKGRIYLLKQWVKVKIKEVRSIQINSWELQKDKTLSKPKSSRHQEALTLRSFNFKHHSQSFVKIEYNF